MICISCNKDKELRLGFCWDCASRGEATAAKRTVMQHLGRMFRNLYRNNSNAKYDLKWAVERLTRTGDYARGGYFERNKISVK